MSQLEFPNLSHKQSYLDMIQEWGSFEALPGIPGRLFIGDTFEEFLKLIEWDLLWAAGLVPSHLYFFVDEGRILWAIQIRHHINHSNLLEAGGHIGYGIRPNERGKWYATEMLRLALIEAKKIGLQKALIVCHDENSASAKVIENNGGVFERFTEKDGKKIRRYWITL